MKCHEMMKKVVQCCRTDETVAEIALRMRDANIGFLPVIDGDGKAIGAVTDRDLVLRGVAAGRPSNTTTVADVMSHEVIACGEHDELRVAEELMSRHQKSRIMCIDADGRIVGVISLSDIAEVEFRGRAATLLRSVSQREVH